MYLNDCKLLADVSMLLCVKLLPHAKMRGIVMRCTDTYNNHKQHKETLCVRISRVVYSLFDKSTFEVSHKELSCSTTYGV